MNGGFPAFFLGLFLLLTPLSAQDRAFKVIMEPPPDYPEVMGHDESPPGSVTLVVGVNAKGEFLDAVVTAYTHIEYAMEVQRAAALWKYRPALVGGKAVGSREQIVVNMVPDRTVRRLAVVNTIDRMFEETIPKQVVQVYFGQRELDAPLAVIAAPPPPRVTVPEDMQVTLDFYVDEEGKPRLPTIQSMDHPELGRIVLETIKEWRFHPPLHDGKAAITRGRCIRLRLSLGRRGAEEELLARAKQPANGS